MHGDGRGQTTTVPFVRGYSHQPGDLPQGHVILVMFKGRPKTGVMPPKKTRKQVRSTDPAAFGTAGVFPSELAALRQMGAFRQKFSGYRGGGSPPLSSTTSSTTTSLLLSTTTCPMMVMMMMHIFMMMIMMRMQQCKVCGVVFRGAGAGAEKPPHAGARARATAGAGAGAEAGAGARFVTPGPS
eukprot:COSAG01_NODE_1330_length_10699_cov_49.561604_9_plen_184_part_00